MVDRQQATGNCPQAVTHQQTLAPATNLGLSCPTVALDVAAAIANRILPSHT